MCFFAFLGPHLRLKEVPRLEVKSELQLPAYATATATQDPSCVCNLPHSSWHCQILNPLSETRDRTGILMDTSRIRFCWEPPNFSLSRPTNLPETSSTYSPPCCHVFLASGTGGLSLLFHELISIGVYCILTRIYTWFVFIVRGLLSYLVCHVARNENSLPFNSSYLPFLTFIFYFKCI